jgi:phage gpG-like protein
MPNYSGYDVTIDLDQLNGTIADLRAVLNEPKGLLRNVSVTLAKLNQDRQGAGLDPEGVPWLPLKNPNLPVNRKGGPLYNTPEMLTTGFVPPQPDGDKYIFGFGSAYGGFKAIFHQAGSRAHDIAPKNKKALGFGNFTNGPNGKKWEFVRKKVHHPGLPARPLLGFPEGDRDAAEDAAASFLGEIIARSNAP